MVSNDLNSPHRAARWPGKKKEKRVVVGKAIVPALLVINIVFVALFTASYCEDIHWK